MRVELALAFLCAFAAVGLRADVKGCLGGGIRVEASDANGIAFRAGAKSLSFAPFRHVAAKDGEAPRISYRMDGDALVVDVAGDAERFGVLSFGRCSERPAGLYFGYGYHVERPARLDVPLNGHQNATRFIGLEFDGGFSLVVATTTPPDRLYVDEVGDSFGFRLSQPTSFTFVPGRAGAFDCALRYRLHEKTPAPPGFAAKAGMFVVDSWNGTFAQHERLVRRAAEEYGVSDAMLYVHCWQRHGFDRRLPEVYPPSPTFGSADDLKRLCRSAREKGWRFGVHLNVIDCYPESPWFDWTRICHRRNPKTGALEPIKAWVNPPHGDQSYRLLPRFGADSIRYQVGQMHADGFAPDTVFIDVTGSGANLAGTCLDSVGRIHTLVENCAGNAEMFDAARVAAGARSTLPAFVSSEAPADYMVGHLDGGDCQWMHLAREPGAYRWMSVGGLGRIEKTPWFPLVYHDRMSLHGAGYSARFEGARGEDCHGIDSDDYLTCEIMNGHSLMADCYNRDAYKAEAGILEPLDEARCLRQIVRKYWLAQHVMREIATATVSDIAFCDETRARLRIRWSTGMTVFVNRSMADWRVQVDVLGRGDVVLPPYGFVAFNPATKRHAAVLRLGGRVVEESAYVEGGRTYRYANARSYVANDGRLPLAPHSNVSQSNGIFRVRTSWRLFAGAGLPMPQGKFRVDWWLLDPMFREYSPKEAAVRVASAVVPLDRPAEASFEWPAVASGARALHVSVSPIDADADDVASRFRLLGTAAFYRRYRQGAFTNGSREYAQYVCPDEPLWERLFPPAAPVDFGWTKTSGAFRVAFGPDGRNVRVDLP